MYLYKNITHINLLHIYYIIPQNLTLHNIYFMKFLSPCIQEKYIVLIHWNPENISLKETHWVVTAKRSKCLFTYIYLDVFRSHPSTWRLLHAPSISVHNLYGERWPAVPRFIGIPHCPVYSSFVLIAYWPLIGTIAMCWSLISKLNKDVHIHT